MVTEQNCLGFQILNFTTFELSMIYKNTIMNFINIKIKGYTYRKIYNTTVVLCTPLPKTHGTFQGTYERYIP